VHFFFVGEQLQIRSLEPRENVPVDMADIIASDVIPEVCEVDAGTTSTGNVFASRAGCAEMSRLKPETFHPGQFAAGEQRGR